MSKNLKKILTTGAALLMFAGVGAGASNAVNPVHAASENTEMARLQRKIGTLHYNDNNLAFKHYRGHEYSFYGMSTYVDGHEVTLAQALRIAKGSHAYRPTRKHYRKIHRNRNVRHHTRKHNVRKPRKSHKAHKVTKHVINRKSRKMPVKKMSVKKSKTTKVTKKSVKFPKFNKRLAKKYHFTREGWREAHQKKIEKRGMNIYQFASMLS